MYLSKITIGTATLLSTILSTTTALPSQAPNPVSTPQEPHTPIVTNPVPTPREPHTPIVTNPPQPPDGSDSQLNGKRGFLDGLFSRMTKSYDPNCHWWDGCTA
ncbi:MAG: hypothetical protein Q9221_005799 [Calogaya cf. arnoldii]